MQPRIKNRFVLPVGELTIPDQSTRSFTVVIDCRVHHLPVNNSNGAGGLKERGSFTRERGLNRGFTACEEVGVANMG